MRLITRQSLASQAADSWAEQYKNWGFGEDKINIAHQLRALGENPSPEDVDNVIGNNSWTRTKCHECGAENIDVVEVGEELGYESHTANICRPCLKSALDIS
jgi:hypothetical protein